MYYEIILSSLLFNVLIVVLAVSNVRNGNVFKETPFLSWLGIFVWGDALVISPFWIISSLISYFTESMSLFLFINSLFWVIRSLGEIWYWLNQQFSSKLRNPPDKLLLHSLLKNDSVWFVYQVFWQCIFVFSVVSSVYFGWKWVARL